MTSKKARVVSLFSGIGAFEKALENRGIESEVVAYCEIDKFAAQSYSGIHGVPIEKNLVDVTKIDIETLSDFDLLTYGFPCQAYSVAGKQLGKEDPRGVLFYDSLKIIRAKKPRVCIAENVKNLTSSKFRPVFEDMLAELELAGYNNYWKVLNAKEHGVPQNRERVFIVSIRKDIDDGLFEFPEGYESGLRLKDLLEDSVDEKYYIETEKAKKLIEQLEEKRREKLTGGVVMPCITPDRVNKRQNGRRFKDDGDPMFTLTGQDRHGVLESGEIEKIGNLYEKNGQNGNVYMASGLSPTLRSGQGVVGNGIGSNNAPKVVTESRIENVGSMEGLHESSNRVYGVNGIAPTLTASNRVSCSGGHNTCKILEEISFVGGIGEPTRLKDGKELSRNFREGYRVYDSEGLASCQNANGGGLGGTTGLYVVKDETAVLRSVRNEYAKRIRKQYESGEITEKRDNMREYELREDGHANTLTTVQKDNMLAEPVGAAEWQTYRIRKLTPKECWRLMGFTDEDFEKAKDSLEKAFYKGKDRSSSQMYKQAGNSIVVNVLSDIYGGLEKYITD